MSEEGEKGGAGRRSSLERLIDGYYEPVFRLLVRLTGSVTTAEDLAQTTFTGLAQSWTPLDTAKRDRAYVMQAAYNAWRQWAKRRAAEPSALEWPEGLAAADGSASDRASVREELALVRAVMDTLPPNHRATLVLIVLEGMSYNQVAEVMGVPRDTVAKWRTRAVARIRKALLDRQLADVG